MKTFLRPVLIAGCGTVLGACGGGGSGGGTASVPLSPTAPLSVGPAACVNGRAGSFACSGVSLASRVPLSAMGGGQGNDLWGWVDPQSGREYALMGLAGGTAFVDVSDPFNPVFLGRLPTQTVASTWRDIKVYANHAYVVADGAGSHGMQVFDLTRLRNLSAPESFLPDVVYGDFGSAHNLAIDEDSGFAYALGTGTCNGGLHMIDIRTANNPLFAGCYSASYTHDAQCVLYSGPDPDYQGHEICVDADEDHVEIVDVTRKSSPVKIASTVYPNVGFTHQGWLTEDQRYFFLGDESDEIDFNLKTQTHVFDLSNLDAPRHQFVYTADTDAVDHNMYVAGGRLYQANYTAGLRILQFGDLSAGDLREVAYFDTYPASDAARLEGAWSVYPHFSSGTIIVSDISNGLFVLLPDR